MATNIFDEMLGDARQPVDDVRSPTPAPVNNARPVQKPRNVLDHVLAGGRLSDFAPKPEPEEAPYNVVGGLGDVARVVGDIPVQTLGAVARIFDEEDPLADPDQWTDRAIKKVEDLNERRRNELTPEQRAEKVFPLPEFMSENGALTRGGIVDTGGSTGFTLASMGAGIAAGTVGSLATPATGVGAGMAASGSVAYRMDKSMITREWLKGYSDDLGRPLTALERADFLDKTDDLRTNHALWEAGPEALGNAIAITGLGKIATGVVKKQIPKMLAGFGMNVVGELATESVTQIGQNRVEHEFGSAQGEQLNWDLQGIQTAMKQVGETVFALSALGGGGAAVYGAAKKKLINSPEDIVLNDRYGENADNWNSVDHEVADDPLGKATNTAMQEGFDSIGNTSEINAVTEFGDAVVSVPIENDTDLAQRRDAVLGFYNDPKISPESKSTLIETGVFQHLGMPVPGTVDPMDEQAPLQDEWMAQRQAAQSYNQERNEEALDYEPELPPSRSEKKFNDGTEIDDALKTIDQNAITVGNDNLMDDIIEGDQDIQDQAENRANRQDELTQTFTQKNALIPPAMEPGITRLEQELRDGQGNEQQVVGNFPSTNPTWFKQAEIKAYDKKHGTEYAGKVSKAYIKTVLKKVRAGESLSERQGVTWDYVQRIAHELQNTTPELVADKEFSNIEKKGFSLHAPESTPVGNINQGDQVVVLDNQGIPDVLTHKGRDPVSGEILLQDGATMHVDEFDTVDVIASKKGKGEANDTTQSVRDTNIEQAGSKVVGEKEKATPALEERSKGEPKPQTRSTEGNRQDEVVVADKAKRVEKITNKDSIAHGQKVNTNPSEAQKDAENYQKAHVKVDGFNVSIENPAGSVRSGTDQKGKEWSIDIVHDYGYFKGSVGFDKDQVDVFFAKGYKGGAENAYIVNQHNKDGSFDEHKAVLGAKTKEDAMSVYNSNYEKGWTGGKSVVEMPMEEFKKWVMSDAPRRGAVQDSGTLTDKSTKGVDGTGKESAFGEFAILYNEGNLKNAAKNLVESTKIEHIIKKIDSIFGTIEEAEAGEEGKGEYTWMHDIALDYRADLEHAANNRYYEETEFLLRKIREEERRGPHSDGQAEGSRNVLPSTKVPQSKPQKKGKEGSLKSSTSETITGAKSSQSATPTTKANVLEELENSLGRFPVRRLLGNGTLTILDTQAEAKQIIAEMEGKPLNSMVYQGSPHRGIEKMSTDYIGTGEGAQVYGWGLYFASKKAVGEWYRKKLTDRSYFRTADGVIDEGQLLDKLEKAFEDIGHKWSRSKARGIVDGIKEYGTFGLYDRTLKDWEHPPHQIYSEVERLAPMVEKKNGQLYKVEIPEDDVMLHWDKPLNEQPDEIHQEVRQLFDETYEESWEDRAGSFTGQDLYRDHASDDMWSEQDTSEHLNSLGIKGIKYLDGTSRDGGSGTHNYVIFDGADTKIVEVFYSKDDQIAGFTDGKTTHLVSDGIEKGKASDILDHELGVHVQKLRMKDKDYQELESSLKGKQKDNTRTGKAIRAAMARVPDDTNPDHYWSEVLAYMVEDNSKVGLVRRFLAMVKKWWGEVRGKSYADKLTPEDLKALAISAIRSTVRKSPTVASGVRKSVSSPVSAPFEKWFGKSKVKNIVYHGSPTFGQDNDSFTFENKPSSNTGSPLAGLGFFFAEDEAEALGYTKGKGNVEPVHLRIENPLEINSYDFPQFSSQKEARAFAKRKQLQGYDGIYIKDQGHWVAFESNQAKSVDKNSGEFSTTNADIRFSKESKPDQEMRNTSILNAELDGETSDSSLSHGEKLIAEIFRKLAATSSPVVANTRFGEEALDKLINKYNEARAAIINPMTSVAEKQKFAAALVRKIPVVPRGKLLNKLSQISRVKNTDSQHKKLKAFMKEADSVLTEYLRKEIQAKLNKAVAVPKSMRKGGKAKKGRGHAFERDIDYLRDTAFPLGATSGLETEYVAEIGRLETESLKLADKLESEKDDEKIADIEEEISDLESFSNILSVFGGIDSQSFDELVRARKAMPEFLEGKSVWRKIIEDRKERNKANQLMVNQNITGEVDPQIENKAEESERVEREQTIIGRIKEALSSTSNMIQSWELMLDIISGKSGKGTLKSDIVKHFGSLAHKGTKDYEEMQMYWNDKIHKEAMRIFGAKDSVDLAKKLAKLGEKKTGKIFISRGKNNRGKSMTMSRLEAAYWYQISRDIDNPVVKDTFEEMGIDSKTIKEIEKFIGPDLKAWADYLVDDFYQDFHGDTNKIHRQRYGIDLDKTPNYVPWHRKVFGKVQDKEKDGFLAGMSAASITKGGLRSRVKSTKAFKIMDINQVLIGHVTDMNHFKAWALPTQEINGTFNSPAVQSFIRQHYGESTARTIRRFQDKFVQTEGSTMEDLKALDKIRGNVTRAMVGMNPVVFFKQLSSIPAYMADIPAADWGRHTAEALSNPRKAARILGRSTTMKARYRNGFERDIATSMQKGSADIVSKHKRHADKFMVLTQLGDKAAIIMGGYAVYKYHLEKLKKGGMPHQKAHKEALTQFEMSTHRTQQSRHTKDLGWVQSGNPLMKVFTMFMTSPASYSRQIFAAVRNFKADPVDSAKRLFVFAVLMPVMFQAIADAFLIFDGDDDDKERFIKNQKKALALGPLNGFPIIRTAMEGYYQAIAGERLYEGQYSPIVEPLVTSKDTIADFMKFLDDGTDRISADDYLLRSFVGLIHTMGYVTGTPTKPLGRVLSGMQDAIEVDAPLREYKPTDHPTRRSLGYSRYAVGDR